jgi:hypothetical protein
VGLEGVTSDHDHRRSDGSRGGRNCRSPGGTHLNHPARFRWPLAKATPASPTTTTVSTTTAASTTSIQPTVAGAPDLAETGPSRAATPAVGAGALLLLAGALTLLISRQTNKERGTS